MEKKKVGRNEPCPCGSGKKYKRCCWNKGFEWLTDSDGNFYRKMPVDKETQDTIDLAVEEFRRKHGRDPYPDEPIFSDLGHPEHVEAAVVDAMKRAAIDPALIYAFEKTGRLVTTDNLDKLPDTELREWQEAVKEYRRRIARGDAPDI